MAFYRKNIFGAHQLLRILLGIATVVAAVAFLSGGMAWIVIISGLIISLSGLIGYCPVCAIAGVGQRRES